MSESKSPRVEAIAKAVWDATPTHCDMTYDEADSFAEKENPEHSTLLMSVNWHRNVAEKIIAADPATEELLRLRGFLHKAHEIIWSKKSPKSTYEIEFCKDIIEALTDTTKSEG